MQDHTLSVDRTRRPASIRFSGTYNAAVHFIERHLVEGRGEKIAIRCARGDVSYSQLAEQVNRCGNVLRECGAAPGDRVLLIVQDCPEFFYLFWGAVKCGVIPVPLNTLLRSGDYRYLIEDSACAGVIYSAAYAPEVEPALAQAALPEVFSLAIEGDAGLSQRLARASAALDALPSAAEDECFWLYSSGSTGPAKGAVHRHRDLAVTCVHYAQDVLGVRDDDVFFSAAKLFFAYGLGNAMSFPLWAGATSVLSDQVPSPRMSFETIERYRPTLFFGVPTLYAAQLRALETEHPDLSSLRLCVSAGEALPADIFRRWQEKTGLIILDGIGSTEALHIFISNSPQAYRPGSSGRVVSGYSARIVDESGRDVPVGQAGRLMIKGLSTAACYWNKPERTAATMQGEWLNTGDTYVVDADGWYTYCGRSDDMLKVGGIWCSPVEIEARLIEHPQVLEAAVVGRRDADGLIKPEAFVVLNDPADAGPALQAALQEHCKSGLARYKFPRWINVVEELPKTATGKIRRFKLRGE